MTEVPRLVGPRCGVPRGLTPEGTPAEQPHGSWQRAQPHQSPEPTTAHRTGVCLLGGLPATVPRVALPSMAHSFIELDKAVFHLLSLVSLL